MKTEGEHRSWFFTSFKEMYMTLFRGLDDEDRHFYMGDPPEPDWDEDDEEELRRGLDEEEDEDEDDDVEWDDEELEDEPDEMDIDREHPTS